LLAGFTWLLTGLVYVVMLFVAPEWRRLIPTSWQIVPDAWRALLSYLSFHIVETPGAYNALQRLIYAAVIFLLAPFSIATGVAMSPAVAARFPGYIKIFHGRQGARSLYFLALCAFTTFFIGHVTMVVLHGFRKELAMIVLGETHNPHLTLALVVWFAGLTGIAAIHVLATACSRRRPRFVQKTTESITDPLRPFRGFTVALLRGRYDFFRCRTSGSALPTGPPLPHLDSPFHSDRIRCGGSRGGSRVLD